MGEQKIIPRNNIFGPPEFDVYEDGKKVGEATETNPIFGKPELILKDNDGHKIGSIQERDTFLGFGQPEKVIRDSEDREVATASKEDAGPFGLGGLIGKTEWVARDNLGRKVGSAHSRKSSIIFDPCSVDDKVLIVNTPNTENKRSGNNDFINNTPIDDNSSSNFGSYNERSNTYSSTESNNAFSKSWFIGIATIILFGAIGYFGYENRSELKRIGGNVISGFNEISTFYSDILKSSPERNNKSKSVILQDSSRFSSLEKKIEGPKVQSKIKVEPKINPVKNSVKLSNNCSPKIYDPDCVMDGNGMYEYQLGKWCKNCGYCQGYDFGCWDNSESSKEWAEENLGKKDPVYFCWNAKKDGTKCGNQGICKRGACVETNVQKDRKKQPKIVSPTRQCKTYEIEVYWGQ